MPAHGKGTIIRWDDAEYLLLTRALLARYPKRNYAAATTPDALTFNHSEFDIVQRKALPKSRQRIMQSLGTARQHIVEILAKLRAEGDAMVLAPDAQSPAAVKRHRNDKNPKIKWDEDEYKQFALAMHTLNPELHFLNSTDLAGLTTAMMNKAAQVMPPDRRRVIPALEAPRKILLNIYRKARAERDPLFYPKMELPQPTKYPLTARQQRMFKRAPAPPVETEKEFTVHAHRPAAATEAPAAAPPAPSATAAALTEYHAAKPRAAREQTIMWTREEWLQIATELHRKYPDATLDDTELAAITTPDVVRAQLVLPPNRQRPQLKAVGFKAILRPKLVSAFRDLKNRLASAAVAAANPPEAKPVSAPGRALPPVTPPGTTAAPKESAHHIRWTSDEWLAIATELHRKYPLLKLIDDHSLFCLTSPDVAAAQRVLDPSRQRPGLKVVSFRTILKPQLLAAFKELKVRLANPAPAPNQPAPQVEPVKPAAPEQHAAPVAAIAAVPDTPPAAAPAEVNPYEAAMKPLVDLLVSQLAKQLQPMLARIIETAGAAVLAAAQPPRQPSPYGAIFQADKPRAPTPPAEDPPPLNTSPAGPSLLNYGVRDPGPSAARQRRPHIGVVGGLEAGAHKAELAKEFPGIEFTCIDSAKHITRVRNCDKVIGMIKFANHPMTGKAKKTLKDRWVPLEGGISEMKRAISIWIASGIIKPQQEAA
jgi:hypothetical protein